MNERTHDKMNLLGMVLVVTLIAVQNCIAGMYITVPKGTIYQAYVDYNDVNTVTITAGYGECSGNYWEITSSMDHDMLSLATGEDFHYIYIDDANSVYPDPCIIDSTVEPSWSDSKLGWYNSNNRCIGVVWSPAGSTTLMGFRSNTDLKWISDSSALKEVLTNGNPDGTNQTLDISEYIPVNAIGVRITIGNSDADDWCWVAVKSTDCANTTISSMGKGSIEVRGWVELPRGGEGKFYWFGQDDDDNSYYIRIAGYQIER